VQGLRFYDMQKLGFVLFTFFYHYGVVAVVYYHFLEDHVSHVFLVKVKALEFVQKQVKTESDFFLLLSHSEIEFIPGPAKALHGVLIEELEENGFSVLFNALCLFHHILMQIGELDNGPEIVLVLDRLLNGNVGDGTEGVSDSGMQD
jgi:hypothetical protein